MAVLEEKIQELSGPIVQQPFPLSENAQALAGTACCAAAESRGQIFQQRRNCRKPFQQGISDSHRLLEFSDVAGTKLLDGEEEEHVCAKKKGEILKMPENIERGRK